MPTQSEMKVPVPESPDEFEKICLDYIKSTFPNEHADQYGRKGQAQHGVDIVADNFNVLVQCKCCEFSLFQRRYDYFCWFTQEHSR